MRKDIEALRDDFYRAHYAISFDPEKRAESCVQDFSAELDADLAELGENPGNYREKYIDHLRTWAARKARCMSPMITGPANFPAASNQKRMNSEQKAWEEFRAWRDRYIYRTTAVRTKSPEEDLDDALKQLEKERAYHEMMLGVNHIIRNRGTTEEKKIHIIEEYELSEKNVEAVLNPEFPSRPGFASFELSNHNALLKRLEAKVLTMKARIQRKETFEPIAFDGGSINIENDRVTIHHDTKPPRETIEALKAHGFRWSPHWSCWCRKHTANALRVAQDLCLKRTV